MACGGDSYRMLGTRGMWRGDSSYRMLVTSGMLR
jgi:hypothetical protein